MGQCSALGPAHSAITTLPPGASVIDKTLRKRTSAPTPSGASKQPGPNSDGSKGLAISVNWPAAAGCPGVGAGSGTGAGAGAGAGDGTGVAGLLPSPPQAQAAGAVAKKQHGQARQWPMGQAHVVYLQERSVKGDSDALGANANAVKPGLATQAPPNPHKIAP